MNTVILKRTDGEFTRFNSSWLPVEWHEPVLTTITALTFIENPDVSELCKPFPIRKWKLVDVIDTGRRKVGYYELITEGK